MRYNKIQARRAPLETTRRWAKMLSEDPTPPVGGGGNLTVPLPSEKPGAGTTTTTTTTVDPGNTLDGSCPPGFFKKALKPGDFGFEELGGEACFSEKDGCRLNYEPDPNNPSMCLFKLRGKPCGPDGTLVYDAQGSCVEQSIFNAQNQAPAPPPTEGMGMGTKILIGLAVLWGVKKVFFTAPGRRR